MGRMQPLDPDAPVFDAAFQLQLGRLFRWRRDVRRFRPDALPEGTIDGLLDVAAGAPSVGLSEPWRFVHVLSAVRREAIRDNFAASNAGALRALPSDRAGDYVRLKLAGLDEAPCHLAVFADPDPVQGGSLGRRSMPQTVAYSVVMAIHTLWLAARAEGIGLGWVSILDPKAAAETLDVPPHWVFIAYLCLGYPTHDEDVPELEREGWERRCPSGSTTLVR